MEIPIIFSLVPIACAYLLVGTYSMSCPRPKRVCKDNAILSLYGGMQPEEEPTIALIPDSESSDSDIDDDNNSDNIIRDSDIEDDVLGEEQIIALNSSESESEDEEADDNQEDYTSASGCRWRQNNNDNQGRAPVRNIIRFQYGTKRGINPENERDAILMFLDPILETVLIYSNLQGRRFISKWNRDHPNDVHQWHAITRIELEAFIGLLIILGKHNCINLILTLQFIIYLPTIYAYTLWCFYLGAFRSNYRDIDELWSVTDGFTVCRATFTRERFVKIKSVLRFDDPLRRDRADSLSPIRHIFETFNSTLRQFYEPSAFLTIDEQLQEYHGRVRFRQYIASKPGKFGIKFFWLCCAETFYVLNGVIYIGIGTVSPGQAVTAQSVTMHLMQPYLDTGRHLTADNWFTSLDLVSALSRHKTSYIGTVRQNNRGIPAIARSTNGRVKKDSRIYINEDGVNLISFWDKANKTVLLFDSFHRNVDQPPLNTKPTTVIEYNRTKSGVDTADKRIRGFTCKRKCRRWPVTVFSNMIDIACNNASIIFSEKRPNIRKQESHYLFNKNAGYQMVKQQIIQRAQNNRIKASSRAAIEQMHVVPPAPLVQRAFPVVLDKSKRCSLCPRGSDKKTKMACSDCRKPMCRDHRSSKCLNCN